MLFWSLGGPLGRPWEITCRFTLIAQAWAGRSFHHYSGHEARYTNRYQSGLDQYHEARYTLSGISLGLILFFWCAERGLEKGSNKKKIIVNS